MAIISKIWHSVLEENEELYIRMCLHQSFFMISALVQVGILHVVVHVDQFSSSIFVIVVIWSRNVALYVPAILHIANHDF